MNRWRTTPSPSAASASVASTTAVSIGQKLAGPSAAASAPSASIASTIAPPPSPAVCSHARHSTRRRTAARKPLMRSISLIRAGRIVAGVGPDDGGGRGRSRLCTYPDPPWKT